MVCFIIPIDDEMTSNIGYLRTKEGMIVCGEVVMAVIGMILNVASFTPVTSAILWFAFWLTFVISGDILLFSLCGLYVPMLNKFKILIWLERAYIGISLILYSIGTILSFINWGISSLMCYGLLVLNVLHIVLRWQLYRNNLATPPPADVNV